MKCTTLHCLCGLLQRYNSLSDCDSDVCTYKKIKDIRIQSQYLILVKESILCANIILSHFHCSNVTDTN